MHHHGHQVRHLGVLVALHKRHVSAAGRSFKEGQCAAGHQRAAMC